MIAFSFSLSINSVTGIPATVVYLVGKNGIEKIVEVSLNADEKELLNKSAEAVKSVMNVLDNMKMF